MNIQKLNKDRQAIRLKQLISRRLHSLCKICSNNVMGRHFINCFIKD